MRLRNILPLVILCFSSILTAQNEINDTLPLLWDIPEITILESRDGLFARTPGSVSYINQAGINRIAPVSGNEVFKTLPGVHVVDEEGAGLRLNLSVRGLDPDRSRGILVLEDGIPVALAPYGEPEMYYTPAIDRMAGIELLKGSGQGESRACRYQQRLAVVLHRYQGLSHREIAEVTGWSTSAVESCLVRAYEQLRKALSDMQLE